MNNGKNDLRSKFIGAVKGAIKDGEYRGRLGAVIDGAQVIQHPDKPTYVYVRIMAGDPTAPVLAKNYTVAPIWGLEVILTKVDDVFEVKGIVTASVDAVQGQSAPSSSAGVAPHTHEISGPMPDYVEPLRFIPGLVSPLSSGFYVTVSPFPYYWDGDWYLYEGGTLDLSGSQPTSGSKRWVKVGFDPVTEALVTANGTAVSGLLSLSISDLSSITFSEQFAIQLGAALMFGSDTTWVSPTQFYDLRGFITGPTAARLPDLLDVSAAADTANFVLATPNGSTGDYLGRALVANDIPNLSADKITSDELLLERGGTESDLSATGPGVLIQSSAGATVTVLKHNLSASTAPTTTDDSAAGYAIGSLWIDTTADLSYICLDATASAAVWTQTSNAAAADYLQVDISDVSNPPTDAELDSIFGTPATAGNGFTAIINDNDADTNVYMVVAVGDVWAIFSAAIAA